MMQCDGESTYMLDSDDDTLVKALANGFKLSEKFHFQKGGN